MPSPSTSWLQRLLDAPRTVLFGKVERPGHSGDAAGADLPVELDLGLVLRVGRDEYRVTIVQLRPAETAKGNGFLLDVGDVVGDFVKVLPAVGLKLAKVWAAKP